MQDQDPAPIEKLYNNRALVPDFQSYLNRWDAASKRTRRELDGDIDIAYGPAPGERLDVFMPAPGDAANRRAGAPVVVFVHGGYWRALDKRGHSFVAPPFVAAGAVVVVTNYDLCPAVTVPEIVMQQVRALAWTHANIARHGGDASRITVVGHSAGGHLAAMLFACLWKRLDPTLPADLVKNALSISGLYDLSPLLRVPDVNASLRLDHDQVRRASPAFFDAPARGEFYSVCGGDESSEFLRHNRLIRETWGQARVPLCEEIAGANHFSVLDALVEPGSRLNTLALDLMKTSTSA